VPLAGQDALNLVGRQQAALNQPGSGLLLGTDSSGVQFLPLVQQVRLGHQPCLFHGIQKQCKRILGHGMGAPGIDEFRSA
jgi:hypothetical protein